MKTAGLDPMRLSERSILDSRVKMKHDKIEAKAGVWSPVGPFEVIVWLSSLLETIETFQSS